MDCIGGDLHIGQAELRDRILKSKAKYLTLVLPRGWGKTYLLQQFVLYYAIEDPGSLTFWVSPTASQFHAIKDELIKAMDGSGLIKHVDNQFNIITLFNDSRIMFGSAESGDNLRGKHVTYLFVDECAFLSENLFNEVLRSMLKVKGKKCILASTPKGKNFFYTLFKQENNLFESFQSNIENPFSDKEDKENARKSMPADIFKQEYNAEFLDDGTEVFPNKDKVCILNKFQDYNPNDKYFAGLDLGNQVDFTCLTIFNQRGELVNIYRNNRQDWTKMVTDLRNLLNQYKPITNIEINSNDAVFNFLQKGCQARLNPFWTGSQSKQDIIEGLILSFNETRILLPSKEFYEPLYKELTTFTYVYSKKTRTVQYGAISGCHDDIVMSLALANDMFNRYRNAGTIRIL